MTADKNSIMWSTSTMDMTSQELHDITIALPENMFLPDLNNELAYLNEEETTDIAVKSEQIYTATVMVPTITMPFVPISPLGPPTRGDFAGQFNFEVQVNGDDTHKKKYLYSYTMNRIYVDQNCNFPMQFKWNHAMAPQQMLVRATAVFSDESQSEYKVKRCLQHVHPSNNTNSLGDICYHVLHSAREPGMDGVFYCGQDKDNSWYSVVVQFPMQPDVGALTFSHVYKFVCKHTCASGINRRPIEVIFTLENFWKFPVWDVARPTPQILMEQARRELMHAEENLAAKRVEEARNRQQMDAKWEELRNKELLLKQSFISFNKFIRENQEKRDRADRKMKEDSESLERKTRETEAMRQRVAEMEKIKQLMEKQVQDYSIYENYLMSVVVKYSEFKQPLDILNRYEALAAAKTTLAARQERDLEMLENARVEMGKLTEDKKLMIMGLNNTLAGLRWRYDKARSRVLKWELALTRLKETAAMKHVELVHVRSAIWSLYLKICKHKGLEISAKQVDFESQLVVIMRALLELRRILRLAQRRAAKDKSSMKAQESE